MGEPATGQQPLAANLGWLLSQASHVLKTELTAALESLGISPRAHHVLKTAMRGEYTQTELAGVEDESPDDEEAGIHLEGSRQQ